jgi:hypothetical protein
MKKILILLLVLSALAWGYENSFVVGPGPLTCTGTFVPHTGTAFVPNDTTPTVAVGNIFYTGVNTMGTAITDIDNPVVGADYRIVCGSIAGGFQSTIADAGNFALEGPWNPVTVGDSITLHVVADNNYTEVDRGHTGALADPVLFADGLIATPGGAFAADTNLGFWRSAAGTISFVDAGAEIFHADAAGGLTATQISGTPIGNVAPAVGTFTNLAATGNFEYGQGFDELHNNYRRTETIVELDDFRGGVDATYAVKYVVTGVVGAGTNTVTVRDGWSELVTGGAGGPDMESTVTVGLDYLRAYEPRAESVVDLGSVAGQRFVWGYYAAANDYVQIVFDTAVGANWLLQVDDTAGVETIDSGIVANINPTKLELVVSNAGVVTWAVDGVPCTVVGLTNNMTAAAHSFRWMETDIAAAAHTVAVDYLEIERNKR